MKPTYAAVAAMLLPFQAAWAAQDHIVVGIDGKAFFEATAVRSGESGKDAVLVLDASDPAHPRIAASLALENSVFGPPTNLQITPDGRLALVANSVTTARRGDGWAPQPTNQLHVIDLDAQPPRLIETIEVGRMPSGIAISRRGDLALVANRGSKSVSVLSIQGTTVRQAAEVPVDDEAAAVAISPDGTRGFVAKNSTHKVGVLAIDGMSVTYDKAQDMPVGYGVYNLDVTPDGKLLLAANTGVGGDGNVDTVSVIDAQASPPRVVDHFTVGDGPEGFAISPDGRHALAILLKGSSALHAAWSYSKQGAVALLGIADGRVRLVGEVPAGNLPEGVAFSRNGEYAYVGNYVDRNLQVYRIADGKLTDTGVVLALPGQPASLRGPAH